MTQKEERKKERKKERKIIPKIVATTFAAANRLHSDRSDQKSGCGWKKREMGYRRGPKQELAY